MAKITEYPRVTKFDDGDVLLKDGANGTKIILASDAFADVAKNTEDITDLKKQSAYPYGPLETNTDVDTINTNGRWWINGANTYTHLPDGMTNGMLISIMPSPTGTSVRMQIAYSNNDGKMYFRYRISSGWGGWKDNIAELANRIWTIAGDNTGVYTRTSKYRNIEIPISTVPGDRIVMVPIYWDGPQNSGFRLIGMKDGAQVITDYKANYLFDVVTAEITDSFDSLRVGVGCDALTSNVTFKVLVFKVGNDMLSPVDFALGNEIAGKPVNLYHRSTDTSGYFITESGVVTASNYFRYTDFIKVKPETDYYLFTHAIGDGSNGTRVHGYDSGKTWKSQIGYGNTATSGAAGDIVINFTTPSDVEWIRFSMRNTNTDTFLAEGTYGEMWGLNTDKGRLKFTQIKFPKIPDDPEWLKPVSLYGKKILLGGASVVHGQGGTNYAMDGDTIIDISGTAEGQYYSSGGIWKRNTNGYCWANLFKQLLEDEYNAEVTNNACAGTNVVFWNRHKKTLIPDGFDVFLFNAPSNDRYIGRTQVNGQWVPAEPEVVGSTILESLTNIKARCDSLGTEMIVASAPPTTLANETSTELGRACTTWVCNEFVKDACRKLNIRYLDIQDEIIRYYYTAGAATAGTYSDALHPDDAMYYRLFFCYCWLLNLSPTGSYEQPPTSA